MSKSKYVVRWEPGDTVQYMTDTHWSPYQRDARRFPSHIEMDEWLMKNRVEVHSDLFAERGPVVVRLVSRRGAK